MTRDGALRTRMLVGLLAAGTAIQLVSAAPGAAALGPSAGLSATSSPSTSNPSTSNPSTPNPLATVRPAQQPATEAGWITGVVVDAVGKPVAGDLVNALGPREVPEVGILSAESDRRTWTDESGVFRVRQAGPHGSLVQICNPEPSDKTVCKETARGVDHVITYVGPAGVTDSWVLQTSLFPTSDNDRDVGTVQVKPQSFVHGHLRHGAGQAVQLLRLNGTVASYNGTDQHGDYRFEGLAPGRYRVQAGGQGSGWLPWRSEVVTLTADRDTEVNGSLQRGADIHGVLRWKGKPVSFTDILVRRLHGPLVAAVTTNEHGFYRVSGLTPGNYRIGILYDGSDFQRRGETVVVPDEHASVVRKIVVQRGAVVTVSFRVDGKPATRLTDELRDAEGRPILGNRNDGRGNVTYTGLAPGTYTVVGATASRYAMTRVRVAAVKTYDLGDQTLARPTLSLSGSTAPYAVVEAKTGQECPPDGPPSFGVFQFIEKADARGHYEMHGLVPGLYMLGADGWPHNYAPRCLPDVTIDHSQRRDLPLHAGGTVSGRLVYASTGTAVITTLSYDLHYPAGGLGNPTAEHPARDRTTAASGRFLVDRLAPATVQGRLSQGADTEQITSPKFLVIYPFQDFTPYYLTSAKRTVEIGKGAHVRLGDVPLRLHH